MKKPTVTTTRNTNRIAKVLLRENAQLLFLPAGSEDLKDSNYEFYLDCDVPEAAIYLFSGRNARVGIGNGYDVEPLLEDKGDGLKFLPAVRHLVPVPLERILQHQFDNLAGHTNQQRSIDFLEWVYANRPADLVRLLEYFLANPVRWLIGISASSPSNRVFSERPIQTETETDKRWYHLPHLNLAGLSPERMVPGSKMRPRPGSSRHVPRVPARELA